MSFGAPTPIEVVVSGSSFPDNRAHAERIKQQLEHIPALRDLQFAQPLDYPTVEVRIDRELAGRSGLSADNVARSLVAATSSSRFVVPNYWRDPKSGVGYQVQVEIPVERMNSPKEIGLVPLKHAFDGKLLLQDVAEVVEGKTPGEYDRYNMRRIVSMTANIYGADLGAVAQQIAEAVKSVNQSLWTPYEDAHGKQGWKHDISGDVVYSKERPSVPPRGVEVDVRGQVEPMTQMFNGLAVGLGMAVLVIFLLLTAYFQSIRLALVVVTAVPAVVAGVALALWVTGTTLNIQSFMGAIMAVGVATANAILLITFAERSRREGQSAAAAAVDGARHRLRPILMTSLAMIAGMTPMALGLGEGGEQVAPLGRAVIGGLLAATIATLVMLPCVFAAAQARASMRSVSLDPDDSESPHFEGGPAKAVNA
jgi:multidrug efflux pump subunit AcrB